jgi:hypothetical protein
LQLGVLGSSLNHSYLIQATMLEVPIESIDVEVQATIDPRSGSPGHENTPVHPQNIAYVVNIASPARAAKIEVLRRAGFITPTLLARQFATLICIPAASRSTSSPAASGANSRARTMPWLIRTNAARAPTNSSTS